MTKTLLKRLSLFYIIFSSLDIFLKLKNLLMLLKPFFINIMNTFEGSNPIEVFLLK